MRGRALIVLMWKHLMVRKRRFIHTAVELTSPILFALLLYAIRHNVKPALPQSLREYNKDNMVKMTEVKFLDEEHQVTPPRFLLYTPNTTLANTLMDEVALKFGLKRKTSLPNKTRGGNYKGYYGFSKMSEIDDFVTDFYTNEALVVFRGLEGDEWTDKLDYTIRMYYRFYTYSYKSLDDVPRDHPKFGEDYNEFMLLQWTIDTSYIKVRTGNTVPQALSVQEFPYYGSDRSAAVKLVCEMLPIICWMSLCLLFVFLMSRLLEERTTGIQELIKMVGVTSNTLSLSHFLNVVPTGLMYSVMTTVLVKTGDNPLIEHSNGFIIFLTLALHFVSVATMALSCSYLAKSTQYTVSISVLAYLVLFVPVELLMHYPPPRAAVLLSGVLPHVPLNWLWDEVASFEQYNYGLSFANISKSHTSTSGPVLLGLFWLVVQCAGFYFISWYLSHVRPGKYGFSMPWNFFCQKQYWTKNEINPLVEIDEEEPMARNTKYFEDTPKDMEVGIRIENVSKSFPKHKALNNVSLEVYKGEITVLLGHNGAGKTTLMSIITGMMKATDGKIYVNGMDSVRQRDQVRNELGLCPQHNMYFPDLTVLQHLMFFTLLKGGSYNDARESSMSLLRRLGLVEKSKARGAALSGGMQRRLQLACALAGGASVLILDEPTSGLDVETRRDLWDLLLSLRGERTVLLTTHFMEEADALGDRVAALHQGQLRCHATTMHLKKAIGTGYRLSFTTNGIPRDAEITSVVTSFVPDAFIKEKTINSLSYNLPAASSSRFPNLFTALEEKRSQLGIETIGVGVSTLEEVFLKLCSDTDTSFSDDEVDTGRIEPTYNKVTGYKLYARQFSVLFKRQLKYIIFKKVSFLILQAIVPIALIFAFTGLFNNGQDFNPANQPDITLNLDMYIPMPERKVFYNVDARGVSLRGFDGEYPKVEFTNANNITDAILRTGKKSILEYNKYLVGIELTDKDAKVLYTTVYRHAAAVAMNLLTNAIASQLLPEATARTITTHNHPIGGAITKYDDDPLKQAKNTDLCIAWTVLVVIIILSTNVNFASLPCRERASGSRHLHVMAGCPAALHWLCTLACHALACSLLLASTGLAAATLDADSTLSQPDMIMTLLLVLSVGCLAFFAFMYLVSFHFAERTTGVVLAGIMVLFGLITTLTKGIYGLYADKINIFLRMFLALASYTMPPHAMMMAAGKCVYVARINAICKLNKHRCPTLLVADSGFNSEKCCAGENPQSYFAFNNFSPATEICYLTCQFVVYMTLVVMTQRGTFNSLCDRFCNAKFKNRATPPNSDEVVRAEAVFVNKEIALPKKQIEDAKVAMLVNDVHKNYHQIIGKSCYAVQGLSFSVKKGECFGLLGVNGAGKSTTFKMLTAEVCTTKGEIYANGHYINKNKGEYLRTLGYCPQFFGLDDFQTGSDNLALLLTLRGLDADDVSSEVKSWIDIVGLEKYSHVLVSRYSGGCTRRLGAAAALCSAAPLTLLDEPTAGVDVAARRRVWSALRRSLRLQRSVLITSHSMDEMEALCSRIGIMAGGRLCALGTPAELRARHAQGHAVVIKVKHATDQVDSSSEDRSIDKLKSSLHSKLNCTLKDEHKTMLHYHINETMRYSDLFAALENLKNAYPGLVEDYSVTETTLEEVFLSFAKEGQNQPANARNGIV